MTGSRWNKMSEVVPVDVSGWDGSPGPGTPCAGLLERGAVIFYPRLAFEVASAERRLFSPGTVAHAKNVSFDPVTKRVGGTAAESDERHLLTAFIERYNQAARQLVESLFPEYRPHLVTGRASFRPVQIAGRVTSWRKDDTRLHVDAFPATPVQGRRILRVFSNVNLEGRARVWRLGGEFEDLAARFAPALRLPLPGSAALRRALRLTKTRRSPYDALMLQLHDRMKADEAFQRDSPQQQVEFPPGTTWLAFTDEVSHAAMSGQYQLEQTFLVPVGAMLDERRSPLRVLERAKNRALA